MYYLGIDWANEKHDLCLLDETGTIIKQLTIAQDLAGFQQLEQLVQRYGVDNIRLNIERADGLLVDWILAQGWMLYLTPTIVVAHRRPRRSSPPLRCVPPGISAAAGGTRTAARSTARFRSSCTARTRAGAGHGISRTTPVGEPSELRAAAILSHRHQAVLAGRISHHAGFSGAVSDPGTARTLTPRPLQAFFKQHHYTRTDREDPFWHWCRYRCQARRLWRDICAQVKMLIPLLRELYHQVAHLEKEIACGL